VHRGQRQRLPGRLRGLDVEAGAAQGGPQRAEDLGLIVDDEDPLGAHGASATGASTTGNPSANDEPAPGAGSSQICPPFASTRLARIDRIDVPRYIDGLRFEMTGSLELIDCCRPLDAVSLSDDEARATAALFRALADPARVRILNLLARSDEPVCACAFEPVLGLSQPTVSHHLKKLTEAGLLEREQRGRWAFFSLSTDAMARLATLVPTQEVVR
jgi:ArsR family transcriptional regulator